MSTRRASFALVALLLLLLPLACVACASAPRAAKPPPHRWTPDPKLAVVKCGEKGEKVSKDAATRTEECRAGSVAACLAIAETEHVAEADAAFARAELGRQCASDRTTERRFPKDEGMRRDRVCSCSAYGSALTYDKMARFDREGLAAIDEGCVSGNYDACDEALLLASLCSVEDARHKRPLCELLRADGRVPKPDPEPPSLADVTLPAELTGCFVPFPGAGGSVVASGPGPVYCFEGGRRLWRTSAGEWDGEKTRWRRYPGDPVVYGEAQGPGPNGVTDPRAIALRVSSGGALLDDGDDSGPRRLARADAKVHDEARALPAIEDVCARAMQCVRDAAKLVPAAEENDAPGPMVPGTLRGCREMARSAAASVRSPPPSCAQH